MKLRSKHIMVAVTLTVSFLFGFTICQAKQKAIEVDVCVYGGSSAGVIAAYTAAKMNKKVLLIEQGKRLGGLSSGGLGYTDIGNKYAVTGLAKDFYRRVGQHYGKFEQWTFEPKVAEAIFMDYVKRGGFEVKYETRLTKVLKDGSAIKAIELENSIDNSIKVIVQARQFIDCSYEGDLMAAAGVSYTIGREANSVYNETVNGVQLRDEHQFPNGIDPYKIPGKPKSGLLWGISNKPLAEIGSGDRNIQAYNFRICLSNDVNNQIAITRPDSYDSSRYELLLRYLAISPAKDLKPLLKMNLMPNHKVDINNNGPFSTDMIGMNYQYPNGDYAIRSAIFKQHEDYTKGLLYFIGHDARIPEHLRNMMLNWGYPKDEYLDNNHWTPQLYVREARRMVGEYVMTQADCQALKIVDDGIGMGAYMMDSHNTQRIVVNGMVKNEGDVQLKDVNPYPVAYRSITPKQKECSNLLVPVCLSASHMAYGSIRMEPVFMVLAQSAAVAACMAIDAGTAIQQIDVKRLQANLVNNPLMDNSLAEIIVDNDDAQHTEKTGAWMQMKSGGYGLSYLLDSSSSNAQIKFKPSIKVNGDYEVYIYYPRVRHASPSTNTIEIFNGDKATAKTVTRIDNASSSGEWMPLGTYHFTNDKSSYVKVSSENAKGAVVADAVLFIAQKLDNK